MLKDRIVHLTDNSPLSDSQHIFRSKRSCLRNLLEVFEHVTASVDRGIPVDVVYLDFQTPFDKDC